MLYSYFIRKNASTSINDKIKSKFLTVASVAVSNVEQLYITCFESPSNFFAQFEKLSSEKLEEMQNGINNHYLNASKSSFKPKIGTIVCAKYSMDNLFYRARIENVVDDNCKVIFIDYGNKETVSFSNIHPLDSKFMIHPPFGIECGLHTYPPATPVEKLQGLMLENSVQAKMIKEENKKWLIALTEDFTGNVAILELLRQHEAVVPRSIHGAGLRGFQEHMTPKENTSFNNNEVHKSRNNFQYPNKFNAGKPQK
ncbi:tudor domain-containing protein 1 [Caerostris extrusa]|uniref:Tudor domain-containing protein 1 n=1 Tax=Caerostris extrusa TaxID=172846 RepID=A0AAV4WQ27_CAEEX|nr:tudor domain-containing protein 1 [Caerostris extrusa]